MPADEVDRRLLRPYVGITGFMSGQEVQKLLCRVGEDTWSHYSLMVGVLVSYKTMDGIPNDFPGSYPPVAEIASIFTDHPRCVNLLHFNSKRLGQLATDLGRLMAIGGPYCHGFQLNIAWPDVEQLQEFKQKHPSARVVLQLGRQALDAVAWDSREIWLQLKTYLQPKVIDDVLIDASGGKGEALDARRVAFLLNEINLQNWRAWHSGISRVRFGVAGGLRADCLLPLRPAYNVVKPAHLNIDAQGQLRTPIDDPANNKLDLMLAYAYLMTGLVLFEEWR